MIDALKIYGKLVRIAFLSKTQYKLDFLVGIVSILVLNSVNLALIGILIYQFKTLNGWGMWDLLFLYSFWMVSRGLYGIFFWHFREFEELVRKGNFDAYLVRPISPFVQFVGKDINYTGVGDSFVGVLGLIIAMTTLAIQWDTRHWIFFVVCIFSGTMIHMAVNWIGATLCFWTTRADGAVDIAERFNVLVQQYPIDIFGKWFKIIVTCFIPFAFINYYPAVVLLNKVDIVNGIYIYISPLVAIILLLFGALLWRVGISRYSSTGN